MMELRALNHSTVSDNGDGVCCGCHGQQSGSMLRCQLCLQFCHCTYIIALSLVKLYELKCVLNYGCRFYCYYKSVKNELLTVTNIAGGCSVVMVSFMCLLIKGC